jgi:peptide/nickel transport system permease protein
MTEPKDMAKKPFYSKDYWDLVFEQLAKRKMFKLSMVVLALLYASAIYAPLIANEKPYVIEGVDYKEYKSATSLMSATVTSMSRLMEQTDAEYLERRGPEAPPTLGAAVGVERDALHLKLTTMRLFLPEAEHGPLDEYESAVDQAIASFAAGQVEVAREEIDAAKATGRQLKRDFAAEPPKEPGGESIGKQLVPQKTYPLMESISPYSFYMMALWALVLLWPGWNKAWNLVLCKGERELIRRARGKKALFVVVVPLLAAFAWAFGVGSGGSGFNVSPHKERLTDGSFVLASDPTFPPIAYGFAESHQEEGFRPPTWKHDSAINEEGYYMYGFRQPKVDKQTGKLPPPLPTDVRYGEPERNAATRHLAGTDETGRDVFTRILWGGRISLTVGILSAFLLTVIGVVMGSLAGFFGGRVDTIIMRIIEILQSIPAFFLILVVMAFTDPEVVPPIIMIVVVIALVRWTGVARLVRGEFMRMRESEFVLAAKALGFGSGRTIFRHVLPNALSPIIVSGAFSVAAGILTESAISFLGFGIQHPGASWGSLVNASRSPEHWWIQIFPGVVIFITVTCYNLAGDALRDALDPKLKD